MQFYAVVKIPFYVMFIVGYNVWNYTNSELTLCDLMYDILCLATVPVSEMVCSLFKLWF